MLSIRAERSRGITPACAGITKIHGYLRQGDRDHPRVCGNYLSISLRRKIAIGSPPRVRELPFPWGQAENPRRITPACAGITMVFPIAAPTPRDHPRVCGNYRDTKSRIQPFPGSPPRVRELPMFSAGGAAAGGITPACAGITRRRARRESPVGDHPRVCGNYL